MYNFIKNLCAEKGISIARMCKECGISPSIMTELKTGRTKNLSAPNLQKISNYFGISPSDILHGNTESTKKLPITQSDELIEILDACKERSDLRGLFCVAKDLPPDDIRKAMAIFEAFKNG